MWKETVRALQTGALGEIALVAFVIAFLGVVAYTFSLTKRQRDDAKHLPLEDDDTVVPPDSPDLPADR